MRPLVACENHPNQCARVCSICLENESSRAEKVETELAQLKEADAYLIGPGCDPCGHLGSGDGHADWCPLGRADKAEICNVALRQRVEELEALAREVKTALGVLPYVSALCDYGESDHDGGWLDRLVVAESKLELYFADRPMPAVSKSEGEKTP